MYSGMTNRHYFAVQCGTYTFVMCFDDISCMGSIQEQTCTVNFSIVTVMFI